MIPETLWQVFSNRWLQLEKAPSDAADWLQRGYLQVVSQGKLNGYMVTQLAYKLIVDK